MIKFQVTFELHGRAFTLTKQASSYGDLVRSVNKEFGSPLILKTLNV